MSGAGPVRPVLDTFGRPPRNLRLSVTDRCNLRCSYCMPEEEYVWLPREDILTFEEAAGLVDVFADLGVDKVRLTGGEPLLRNGLERLVILLAANPRLRDLAITTNGILLAERAAALRAAGLHRVTVSLDTLRPDRFKALTRREALPQVLEGIACGGPRGIPRTQARHRGHARHQRRRAGGPDRVRARGARRDPLHRVHGRGRCHSLDPRPGGLARRDAGDAGPAVRRHRAAQRGGSAPADRYRLPDGYVFGIIASTTAPFCQDCDRSRLTADGMWYLCLYATQGTDLRKGAASGRVARRAPAPILPGWAGRKDRGAEDRLAMAGRPLAPHPDRRAQARSPPRDAHQGRLEGRAAAEGEASNPKVGCRAERGRPYTRVPAPAYLAARRLP